MGKSKKTKKKSHKQHGSSGGIHSSHSQSSLSRLFDMTTKDKGPAAYLTCLVILLFVFAAFFIFLDPIRNQLGFGTSKLDPAKQRHYRTRLKNLYEKYNPSKLDEIDSILEKWRGKETQLFKQLHKKYRKSNNNKKDKNDKKNSKRRRNSDGEEIPDYNNETPEQASARRRAEKEKNRKKRKEEREGYYDDWSDEQANYDDIKLKFDSNAARGEYIPEFEREISLMDEKEWMKANYQMESQ